MFVLLKSSLRFRLLAAVCLALASAVSAFAYAVEEQTWRPGAHVIMHLGLGSSPVTLQDGFSSFNASAADAAAIWNGYLDFISFTTVSSSIVAQQEHDGVSAAFFSSTVFGEDFGGDTLAVTVIDYSLGAPDISTEADVVVNTAFQFDSYRGPKQPGVYDFHRVILHEFGHVLGLDHVTFHPPGQALMEPVISDLDHLGPDDVLGIERLYQARLYNTDEPVTLRVGDPFSQGVDYFGANNAPTSYTVTGLPAGMTYNSATKKIEGAPTVAGSFGPVITAHGPITDAYGSLPITVFGLDRVQGLQAILRVSGRSMYADPVRPRIYTAGPDGVNMIDANTFTVTNILPSDESGAVMSVSADSSLLLFTIPKETTPLLHRIDLSSLTALPSLRIPAHSTAVLEGPGSEDYVAGIEGVYQFDRSIGGSGVLFAPVGYGPSIAISPDRTTLYVGDIYSSTLALYDITGAQPVLKSTVAGSFSHLVPSPDGNYLYHVSSPDEGAGQLFQDLLPDAIPSVPFAAADPFYVSLAIGLDGSIYESGAILDLTTGTFGLYDPESLKQTANVKVDRFPLLYNPTFEAGTAVFDSTGKHLFVFVGSYLAEVWVFPTNVASIPPPPPDPTKNLLNISTRAHITPGDGVAIGGFIVQGSHPKKLLIRGIGPSLTLTGAMDDPALYLYDSAGKQIATNNDWGTNRNNILGTQLAPSRPRESAIVATLAPGSYTAVVQDQRDQPGLALIEVYDLDPGDSAVANISTRGEVGTGDDVMIGGFIIGGTDSTNVLVRALGPSLRKQGVASPLSDPVLEIHDSKGKLIETNDNWRSTQETEIKATGIPPANDLESAVLLTLAPGSYTAIVRGQHSATGVALVEIYNLDASGASN